MIFGKSTDILLQKTLDESSSELLETYSAAVSRLGLRILLGRLWIFNAWDKTYEALARRIHAVIDKYIDQAIERRRRRRENPLGQPGPYQRSVVDSLLAISGIREEVRDQLVNIFLPARDAAAVGLSACLFHLARHPDVWNKLRAEVLSIQGPLTRQALLSLPYMQAVLNESKFGLTAPLFFLSLGVNSDQVSGSIPLPLETDDGVPKTVSSLQAAAATANPLSSYPRVTASK
jgi:hypothetical protein